MQNQTSQLGPEFVGPLSFYKDLGSYFEWENPGGACKYVCAYACAY